MIDAPRRLGPGLLELHASVLRGQCTHVDRVRWCLDAIDAREAEVRAWVLIDRDGALESARRLDLAIASGRDLGPIAGAVLGVKDIIDVSDMPTRAGAFPPDFPASPIDAPLVRSLRDAGSIILGKTVTTAHAFLDPPPTANPHDLTRTPGGSSSGSAAAVAAGFCEAALGTQTGGSLVRPASFCGVAALKPGFGVLPTNGIRELARSLDHPGFLARGVEDLDALFRAATSRAFDPPLDASTPRLARLRGFLDDTASPEMRSALDLSSALLGSAGSQVRNACVDEPSFTRIHDDYVNIIATEAAQAHRGPFQSDTACQYYPARIRALIEQGFRISAPDYLESLGPTRDRHLQAFLPLFDEADLLLLPSAPGEAPDPSTTGDPYFNSPVSYLGLPVIGLPMPVSPGALPLGVQLVGRPGSDVVGSLFRHALWVERVLGRRPT